MSWKRRWGIVTVLVLAQVGIIVCYQGFFSGNSAPAMSPSDQKPGTPEPPVAQVKPVPDLKEAIVVKPDDAKAANPGSLPLSADVPLVPSPGPSDLPPKTSTAEPPQLAKELPSTPVIGVPPPPPAAALPPSLPAAAAADKDDMLIPVGATDPAPAPKNPGTPLPPPAPKPNDGKPGLPSLADPVPPPAPKPTLPPIDPRGLGQVDPPPPVKPSSTDPTFPNRPPPLPSVDPKPSPPEPKADGPISPAGPVPVPPSSDGVKPAENPSPPPAAAQTVEPPAPDAPCPWVLRVEIVKGRTLMTAQTGREVQFRVSCDKLEMQAPRGSIQAAGNVTVESEGLQGSCDQLTINWQADRVILEGRAELKCRREGQEVDLKAARLSLRLSVSKASIEAVRGVSHTERKAPAALPRTHAPRTHDPIQVRPAAPARPRPAPPAAAGGDGTYDRYIGGEAPRKIED